MGTSVVSRIGRPASPSGAESLPFDSPSVAAEATILFDWPNASFQDNLVLPESDHLLLSRGSSGYPGLPTPWSFSLASAVAERYLPAAEFGRWHSGPDLYQRTGFSDQLLAATFYVAGQRASSFPDNPVSQYWDASFTSGTAEGNLRRVFRALTSERATREEWFEVECDLSLEPETTPTVRRRGRVRSVTRGESVFSFSPSEWESFENSPESGPRDAG